MALQKGLAGATPETCPKGTGFHVARPRDVGTSGLVASGLPVSRPACAQAGSWASARLCVVRSRLCRRHCPGVGGQPEALARGGGLLEWEEAQNFSPSCSALGAISGSRQASLMTPAPTVAVAPLFLPVTFVLALGEPACRLCHSSLRRWWHSAVADLWAATLSPG